MNSNDVFRVTVKMSDGEDDIQNVYHVRIQGSNLPTEEDFLDDLAAYIDTAYGTFDDSVTSNVTYDGIEVYNLTADTFVGEAPFPVLTNGGITPPLQMPSQCAPMVLFTTGVLKSVGKKFLPFLGSVRLDQDGTLNTTALQELGNFATTLLTGIIGGDWNVQWGNYRPLAAQFIEWLGFEVADQIKTQTRRYRGRGS